MEPCWSTRRYQKGQSVDLLLELAFAERVASVGARADPDKEPAGTADVSENGIAGLQAAAEYTGAVAGSFAEPGDLDRFVEVVPYVSALHC